MLRSAVVAPLVVFSCLHCLHRRFVYSLAVEACYEYIINRRFDAYIEWKSC